jgi:hypothetical protein
MQVLQAPVDPWLQVLLLSAALLLQQQGAVELLPQLYGQ